VPSLTYLPDYAAFLWSCTDNDGLLFLAAAPSPVGPWTQIGSETLPTAFAGAPWSPPVPSATGIIRGFIAILPSTYQVVGSGDPPAITLTEAMHASYTQAVGCSSSSPDQCNDNLYSLLNLRIAFH
jgi:hypothetical protein